MKDIQHIQLNWTEACEVKVSSLTFAPGKLRWNPYSVTLYKVASTLHSGMSLLPPQLGWVVVDGLAPAPSMSLCTEESTRQALNIFPSSCFAY